MVTEGKVETLFFIPYIGFPSVTFGRKIRELLKKKYYVIDLFTTFKVRNYFLLKCKNPLTLHPVSYIDTIVYAIQILHTLNFFHFLLLLFFTSFVYCIFYPIVTIIL